MNLTQIKDKVQIIKNKIPKIPQINKRFVKSLKIATIVAMPILFGMTITADAEPKTATAQAKETQLATSISTNLEDNIFELASAKKVEIVVGESEAERQEREAREAEEAEQAQSVSYVATTASADRPVEEIKAYAYDLVSSTWDVSEWAPFDYIVGRESGWDWQATNSSSGAYGLGQALPASKMGDLGNSPEGQVQWVISYIAGRYGTPSNAHSFWISHGWY